MKVAVWDTYVTRKDGRIMHFDIIVEDGTSQKKVFEYGREYLKTKKEKGQKLTSKECNFCHTEEAKQEVESSIKEKGYYIYEMENCD